MMPYIQLNSENDRIKSLRKGLYRRALFSALQCIPSIQKHCDSLTRLSLARLLRAECGWCIDLRGNRAPAAYATTGKEAFDHLDFYKSDQCEVKGSL
jgi:hypothetical protein